MDELIDALVFYVAFVFSATLHEAAHAWAGKRGGDETAYVGGQVSIDPLPHIRREPIGMVLLPVVTVLITGWPFGYASAPYDPDWARRYPRRAAWMALAGPGANLLLLLLTGIAVRVGMSVGLLDSPDRISMTHMTVAAQGAGDMASALGVLLSALFTMNFVLLVINLLPVPPLDGSGALGLVLSDEWGERYRELCSQPGVSIMGIIAALLLFREIAFPLFMVAVGVLYPEARYS